MKMGKKGFLYLAEVFSGGIRLYKHNKIEKKLFRTFFDRWNCVRKKIAPFCAIAQFCNVFMNCSATITRIFKIFGALFLHFEYASFEYHKPNIR